MKLVLALLLIFASFATRANDILDKLQPDEGILLIQREGILPLWLRQKSA
jgi:hypothetical protein